MHLWPSTRLRDSFKTGYLKNLEWNLRRMNNEKKNQSQTTKLLDDDPSAAEESSNSKDTNSCVAGTLLIFTELFMVLSCCYCCFCCGACTDEEEN